MERYDYLEAVKEDVLTYIKDTIDLDEWSGNSDGLKEKLKEDLPLCDSVTGNASGSYTCNRWKAEEYICHNFYLLADAISYFEYSVDILNAGPEECDVLIRCYLLSRAVDEVIDELESEGSFDDEESE